MKTVPAKDIREAVAAMCIAANRELPADVRAARPARHVHNFAADGLGPFLQILKFLLRQWHKPFPMCLGAAGARRCVRRASAIPMNFLPR